MTTVVHCLQTWCHHLLGSKFVVLTDGVATSYFQLQKKLSPKKARWLDFLAEFDMEMQYKPGRKTASLMHSVARLNLRQCGSFIGRSTIDFARE